MSGGNNVNVTVRNYKQKWEKKNRKNVQKRVIKKVDRKINAHVEESWPWRYGVRLKGTCN